MFIAKVLLLQGFWFFIVLLGKNLGALPSTLVSLGLMGVLLYFYKVPGSALKTLMTALMFTAIGLVHDVLLVHLQLVEASSYSWAYLLLWPLFALYYEDIFPKLKPLRAWQLFLLGGVGGALAYFSAVKLGALQVPPQTMPYYLGFTFGSWSVFFPWSFKMYYSKKLWNKILDATVMYSFDQTGYERHKEGFSEDPMQVDLKGRAALVTGGTSGIGKSAALDLATTGATVVATGRNPNKGQALEQINNRLKFTVLDLTDWGKLREFAEQCQNFDYVVLNAGGMPEEMQQNAAGVEHQCASQLLGHLILIQHLRDNGKIKPGCRIVWVSSGGMYLKSLDLETLFSGKDYEKVSCYANVKRAQVTLVEELVKMEEWQTYEMYAMHPGWVKTEGVIDALPGFTKLFNDRLREPRGGSDTIHWLLATKAPLENGGFYFDRERVKTYVFKSTVPSRNLRQKFLSRIASFLGKES